MFEAVCGLIYETYIEHKRFSDPLEASDTGIGARAEKSRYYLALEKHQMTVPLFRGS